MTACGALVLAGGRGRRVGRPKATIELAGMTLVERAVAIVRAAGCDPIRVATRPDVEVPGLEGVEVVLDPPGDEGPLRAMAAALRTFPEHSDVVVLACDLPNAAPLVERLTRAPGGTALVAVDAAGREQPLCARYPRDQAIAAAEAALTSGDRRMRALIDALRPDQVRARGDELLNVNAPADLRRAETESLGGEKATIDHPPRRERPFEPDDD